MKNTGMYIASLIGGMVLGSAITLLLAPQSGKETREDIKEFIEKKMEQVRCRCDEKLPQEEKKH